MARIRDIIQGKQPDTIGPDATVLEAARKMTTAKVGALAVIENGRLARIFSERDLMTRLGGVRSSDCPSISTSTKVRWFAGA